jgi:glycosyltransferase involved in cell wall biosynthesis
LSVVIPVYNERTTIEEILRRVAAVSIEKEIIVVDDGSTDGTREWLKDYCNWQPSPSSPFGPFSPPDPPPAIQDPRSKIENRKSKIRLFLQERNQGKGAALREGFRAAVGDIVIVQDADLEYDPQEYPRLIEPILSGRADVVYGSRFLGSAPHRVLYFWHYVGNRFLTLFSNMFTNLNLSDMETGYKVFRRQLIQSIEIRENRFGFEPEITAKIARKKARVYEVGISYSGREYSEGKKITWRDGLWALWCIIRYSL